LREAARALLWRLTNAIRRTLTGSLQKDGWKNIHRLMVHRNETYLQFILLGEDQDVVKRASYGTVVNDGFSSGGKSMLTPRNSWAVDEVAKEVRPISPAKPIL
jgi:hypothetical protein